MPAFMYIEGIKGEAEPKDYKDWIQISSMSCDIHRTVESGAKGPDRKRGGTMLGDVSVTRMMDSSSVPLQVACAGGEVKNPIKIHLCVQSGQECKPVMTYELQQAIISGYMCSASDGQPPSENLTLNYEAVKWHYNKLDAALNPVDNFPGAFNPQTMTNE